MKENEINKSNKIKIIVITALIFLVSIAGISYAYFTIQVTGNEEASSIRVTAASLRLIYRDTLVMSATDVYPGWSQTKTISVENDGTDTVSYNIIWRDLLNGITNNELKISATCSSSSGTCSGISETVIPTYITETHNVKIKENISIAPGVTHTYTVTVSFPELSTAQDYNQGKTFRGTLNIEEGSTPATLSLLTDTGTTGLSTGDVVRTTKAGIDNQDFYIVSTNASETVLLAKYNLLVGDVLDVDTTNWIYTLNKTMNSNNTANYGLQSSTAKGWVNGDTQYVGAVPFSGTNYWDDGSGNLISPYNSNGASYSGSPYPYVYNSSLSTIAPSIDYTYGHGLAQNNGYTIAYYVEEYINTLGINGTGRLLTFEEAVNLGCNSGGNCASTDIYEIGVTGTAPTWVYSSTYWLGSASDDSNVWGVGSDGALRSDNFFNDRAIGVRPVIVVPTSSIHTS